jgi:hypothetical protein
MKLVRAACRQGILKVSARRGLFGLTTIDRNFSAEPSLPVENEPKLQDFEVIENSPLNRMRDHNTVTKTIYSSRQSGDYLTFLALEPTKMDSTITLFEICLKDIDKNLSRIVIGKLKTLFKLRIVNRDMSDLVWKLNKEGVENQLTEEQKEFFHTEYEAFVQGVIDCTSLLKLPQVLQLFNELVLTKLNSHAIWRTMISRCIEQCNEMSLVEYTQFAFNLNVITRRYIMIEFKGTDYNRIGYLFENQMVDFINYTNTIKLMDYIIDLTSKATSIQPLMVPLYKTFSTLNKYLKVSALTTPRRNMMLDKASALIHKSLVIDKSVPVADLLSLFGLIYIIPIIGKGGPLADVLCKEILKAICDAGLTLDKGKIKRMLGATSTKGVKEMGFFLEYVKPIILKSLQDSIDLTMMGSALHYLFRLDIDDKEILDFIALEVSKLDDSLLNVKEEGRSIFANKYLHNAFVIGIVLNKFTEEQKGLIARVSNNLTALCQCGTYNREVVRMPIHTPPGFRGRLLYHPKRTADYLLVCAGCASTHETVMSLAKEPSEANELLQGYPDNYMEVFIKNIIRFHLPKFLDEEYTVSDEEKAITVCVYKWDMVMKFARLEKKVGVEISGEAYSSRNEFLDARKRLKFKVLEKCGDYRFSIYAGGGAMKVMLITTNTMALSSFITLSLIKEVKAQSGIELRLKPGAKEQMLKHLDYYNISEADFQ